VPSADPRQGGSSAAVLRAVSSLPARWLGLTLRWSGSSGPAALTDPAGADWPMSLEEAVPAVLVLVHSTAFSFVAGLRSWPKLAADS